MKVKKRAELELNFYVPNDVFWQSYAKLFIAHLPDEANVTKITKVKVKGVNNESVSALKYHVIMPYSTDLPGKLIKALRVVEHLFKEK